MKKILFCLWLFAYPVGATSFNEGLEAYNRHDYQQAYAIWQKLANTNTRISDVFELEASNTDEKSSAQYAIGMMYWQGKGVRQSYADASNWMSQAAENGHKEAALKLATLYAGGLGGTKNLRKSAKWMTVAARAGLHEAQYNLGLMYLDGVGVDQDQLQARYWLQQAANAGFGDAGKKLAAISNPESTQRPPTINENIAKAEKNPASLPAGNRLQTSSPALVVAESQQPNNQLPYAIQIAATNDMGKAQKLAEQYADVLDLKLYLKDVNQQKWYVLLNCCFASRSEANQTITTLPKVLRTQNPFIIGTAAVSPVK